MVCLRGKLTCFTSAMCASHTTLTLQGEHMMACCQRVN